jgi:hypothetical protein
VLMEQKITLASFDGEQQGDESGGPEFVVFDQGLSVKGAMRLGNHHSIYVVLGDLEAGSIETGDAVLYVSGKVKASRYLLNFNNEGIFQIGGTQKLSAAISCPLIFWHDRTKRETILQRDGSTVVGAASISAQLKDVYVEIDMDEPVLKTRLICEALRKGKTIFKEGT